MKSNRIAFITTVLYCTVSQSQKKNNLKIYCKARKEAEKAHTKHTRTHTHTHTHCHTQKPNNPFLFDLIQINK